MENQIVNIADGDEIEINGNPFFVEGATFKNTPGNVKNKLVLHLADPDGEITLLTLHCTNIGVSEFATIQKFLGG
jgi:hypothetical protein